MKKRVLPLLVSGMLAASLAPSLALAGQQELVAGSTPEATVQTQGQTSARLASQTSKKAALAKKTKSMRSRYKAVLRNARLGKGSFNKVYRENRGYVGWYVNSYALYDVDKNGTPELFVHAGTCSANMVWYVFTVKSGKAKCLGRFGDGNAGLSSGKGHAVYGVSGHMGVERVYLGRISGGKIKSRIDLVDTSELQGYPKVERYARSHRLKTLPSSNNTYDYTLIDKAKVKK